MAGRKRSKTPKSLLPVKNVEQEVISPVMYDDLVEDDPELAALRPADERHRAFCENYAADPRLSAQDVATAVGFKGKSAGRRLLQMPALRRYIQALIARQEGITRASKNAVMEELSCIAFSNLAELYDEDGKLIPINQLPKTAQRCIEAIEFDELGKPKRIKLADKEKALSILAKHFGILVERKELSGPNGGPVEIIAKDMSLEEATETYLKLVSGD